MRTLVAGTIFVAAIASSVVYARGRTSVISISTPIELSTITPAYPCDTNVQAVAAGICTVYTPNGKVQGNFSVKPKSNVGGGQCGITVYEIECL